MPCLNRRIYFLYPLCPLKCSGPHYDPAGIAVVQKIHEKVMSLGYQDAVTEIYSVDSQYSLQDGVIVQVTGSLRCTVS
jgi:Nuclear transport factor 2 (NTF2) domain